MYVAVPTNEYDPDNSHVPIAVPTNESAPYNSPSSHLASSDLAEQVTTTVK